MSRLRKGVKKLIVGLFGFPLLALGIILIPLPGPGVLISLFAFFILSLGFDWADRYFRQAKGILAKIWRDAREKADRFEEKHSSKDDEKR